jgi:hypothetical protein
MARERGTQGKAPGCTAMSFVDQTVMSYRLKRGYWITDVVCG